MLEAKSWDTHVRLGTTVGDAACRTILILVMFWFSCYILRSTAHRVSANDSKQQCCWLYMSIGDSGGTAVKYAALVAAPFGLAVLACIGPRLLPRPCSLTVWYHKLYALVCIRIVRVFGWSCVLRSFAIYQVGGFIMFVRNYLFCFAALPRCPCPLAHDGFAISFFQ